MLDRLSDQGSEHEKWGVMTPVMTSEHEKWGVMTPLTAPPETRSQEGPESLERDAGLAVPLQDNTIP